MAKGNSENNAGSQYHVCFEIIEIKTKNVYLLLI